jgi:O-antigen/teichoic acid export membrane protein
MYHKIKLFSFLNIIKKYILKQYKLTAHIKNIATLFLNNKSSKNVFWNLFGGFWAAILIVLSTPWYVSILGLDGYGILSIWLILQVMMGLFDFGLGATLIKEFASSQMNAKGYSYKRDLLRTIEVFYWIITALVTSFFFISSGFIGNFWLNSNALPSAYIIDILRLICVTLLFQFPNSLYTNGLAGLQEHKLMNILQIIGNTLRYGGGGLILIWKGELIWFFFGQILVAIVVTFGTRFALVNKISAMKINSAVFRKEMLLKSWRFSSGMALTAVAAILMSNIDRIAISNMLSTTELGMYAVAFTATGILQLAIQPFYRSFFPKFSELFSLGEIVKLNKTYFMSCKIIGFLIIPIGIIGFLFAHDLFFIWIGNRNETIVKIFRLLLIGITCSGLMWLPAAFQQAQGWTRLHVSMMLGALIVGTPIMILAIQKFGVIGATTVWVIHGLSEISLGLWLMHKRLLIGHLLRWYRSVLLYPILLSFPLVCLSKWFMPCSLDRFDSLIWIGITGVIVVGVVVSVGIPKDNLSK